jgi:hypothetical protein
MPFKTYATVAVALVATLLFCALVSMTLSQTEAATGSFGSGSGSSPTAAGAKPGKVSSTSVAPGPRISRSELTQQIAAMRDMHARMSAAISGAMSGSPGVSSSDAEVGTALLPDSDRLMQEGLVMMRTMKSGLPTTESGEIIATELTAAQSESVQAFLELMDALIVMKGDRDSAVKVPVDAESATRRPGSPPAIGQAGRSLVRLRIESPVCARGSTIFG